MTSESLIFDPKGSLSIAGRHAAGRPVSEYSDQAEEDNQCHRRPSDTLDFPHLMLDVEVLVDLKITDTDDRSAHRSPTRGEGAGAGGIG